MSFVFDNGAAEVKRLTVNLSGQIASADDLSIFGWFKGPNGKYSLIGEAYESELVVRPTVGFQQNNLCGSYANPYGQDGASLSTANAKTADEWTPVIATFDLGGNATLRFGAGAEVTDPLGGPWGNPFDSLWLGAMHDNGSADFSQTFRLAWVCFWKAALSSDSRDRLLKTGAYSGGTYANPLAVQPDDIVECWSGASLVGDKNGLTLSWSSTAGSVNDADNPTIDAPPGGASAEGGGMLLGSRRNRLTIP